jgi:hypothetical protein
MFFRELNTFPVPFAKTKALPKKPPKNGDSAAIRQKKFGIGGALIAV